MSDLSGMLTAMPLSIWVGVAVAVSALFAAALLRANPLKRRVERLTTATKSNSHKACLADQLETAAGRLAAGLGLKGSVSDPLLRLNLKTAGLDTKLAAEIYVLIRFLLPIALFGLIWAYTHLVMGERTSLTTELLAAAIAGFIGLVLPKLYLKNRTDKRRTAIERDWPDALDLLVLTVEAGLPLDSAFSRVANELRKAAPILALEMETTVAEMILLPSRREAFENLALRTDTAAVRRVVAALIHVEGYGGAIASVLRTQARESRQVRMAEAERRAAALGPLMTVPMILFFMPGLFALIMTPSLIAIFGGW